MPEDSYKIALLITEDKDFGELVFRLKRPHRGILLLRAIDKIADITPVVFSINIHYLQLKNKFSVIDSKRLRINE